MQFDFDERASDLSFVEKIWRTEIEHAGSFVSVAETRWEIVIQKQYGKTHLIMRGPETRASNAPVPPDAEIFGIIFKLGTYMPHFPTRQRVDTHLILPEASGQSFWLHGAAWQMPDFENADTFLYRLVREGLIAREPLVDAALQGHPLDWSARSVQRRFLHATGLTHTAIRQIERARRATALLEQGISILDTVALAGYTDQPHLTRSLKHYIGRTPAQILRLKELV